MPGRLFSGAGSCGHLHYRDSSSASTLIGFLALYAIYASIRGLIAAFGLRTHAGLISSIFGLFFSLLSLLVTLPDGWCVLIRC